MHEKGNRLLNFMWRIFMFFWAMTIAGPILWIIILSLKTNREFFQSVWALPKHLQWVNYINAWNNFGIGGSIANTLYYILISLAIGIFLTTMNAYALTRLKFKGRKIINSVIMISLFLPGITATVPLYIIMSKLHMLNSLNGLIILSALPISVFNLFVLSGFMQSIPTALEESAKIDGAGIFRTFFQIIIPLSIPGIVTISIFSFLGLYNNFFWPFITLSDPNKYTIAVKMYEANIIAQYKSDWVTLSASFVITMIPSIIIYVLFQKQIVKGASLGGVKG